MAQKEEITGTDPVSVNGPLQPAEQDVHLHFKHYLISKKVTDHLANERTFLAWIRTGLSIIAFGFVVERFGLLLRELGLKNTSSASTSAIHYSAIIGVSLVILGVIMMIVALFSFLRIRRSIDEEKFHPQATFE